MGKTQVRRVRTSCQKVPFEGEDRSRMERLYEEVEGRLKEMVLIATRVMVKAEPAFARAVSDEPVIQFGRTNADRDRRARLEFKGIEMTFFGSGPGMCLCYDHDGGLCFVC